MSTRPNEVDVFVAKLRHPHADAFKALRTIILAADPRIGEGIKWNVPSFRTSEYFATFHLRTQKGVGVILHFGAKKRVDLTARVDIRDPQSMLTWIADDRAVVAFADLKDVQAKAQAFSSLIRQWIGHVS
jgi:hypothetical protein